MSTRSCLARAVGDGWKGIYCHWDGYPTHRGPEIWADLHGPFKGDVEAFLKERVDGHPKGWSSFPDSCYCHSEGFADRDDPEAWISSGDGEGESDEALFIEWVYVLAPRRLTVFKGVPTERTWMYVHRDRRSWQRRAYRWEVVAGLPLAGPEPLWQEIGDAGDVMSERAYAALEAAGHKL